MQKFAVRCAWFAVFVAMTGVAPALCEEPTDASDHVVSHIPRHEVQSTAIAKVGYSKRRHILEIEFVNGAVYRYFDVPVVVYHDLMSSQSKAGFYDSDVKRHYRSVLVRPRQKQESPEKAAGSGQGHAEPKHD